MSDQTKIQTAGPADPNAPIAAKFYAVSTGFLGLVGVAATFGLITAEQSASLGAVASTGGAFIGAVTAAVAAFRTRKQVNNGTFDPAPPAPPAIAVLDQLPVIKQAVDKAVAHQVQVVDQASAAIRDVAAQLPVAGPAVGRGADLVADLLRAVRATDENRP